MFSWSNRLLAEGRAGRRSNHASTGRRVRSVFVLSILLLSAAPAALWAHGGLKSSKPAARERLSAVPNELVLTFNERIELATSRLTLTGPHGLVSLDTLRVDTLTGRILSSAITDAMVAGSYRVDWQIAGADGHPVRGNFVFTIAPDAAGLAPVPAPGAELPPADHHPTSTTTDVFDVESAPYVAVRWLTFVALLGTIGAVAFRAVISRMKAADTPAFHIFAEEGARRAAVVGGSMAGLMLLAAALRLFAQSFALHGAAGATDLSLIRDMLTLTRWGWSWLLQVTVAAIAVLAFHAARRGSTAAWLAAGASTILLSYTPALAGHASAITTFAPAPVLADGLHVIGAGGWLGSLLLIVVVGLPVAARMPDRSGLTALANLVNAFSPTALMFAGMTVASGVFSAWLHIGAVSDLWQTPYGRTLLVKVSLLAVLFATGAYNWLRVRPALGSEQASSRLKRSAAVELIVGATVLLVTAILVATDPGGGS